MRQHWKLALMLPLLSCGPAPAAAGDTESACAAFSQATVLVNANLTLFIGHARREGWSYDDPGMTDALQKAAAGLAQAGQYVEVKVADAEPGPAQNALRQYSATAMDLGEKISRRATFPELVSSVESYNAAVHTANGACGLGIGGPGIGG